MPEIPSTPQMDTIVLESASGSSQLISTPLSERVAQLIGRQASQKPQYVMGKTDVVVFGDEV